LMDFDGFTPVDTLVYPSGVSKSSDSEASVARVPSEKGLKTVSSSPFPVFTEDQVASRDGIETPDVWVHYEGSVYDITDFVSRHPGGKKNIMMGAGGDIAPFWNYWSQHRSHPKARKMLEAMKIGVLDQPSPSAVGSSPDPSPPASEDYVNEPPRRSKSALRPLVHAARTGVAFEAETSPVMLRTFVTPNHAFYVRNHAPVPEAGNAAEMPLQVGDKTANYLDLLTKHGKATLISTIQCTGNRLGEVAEAMGKDSYFEAAPSGIGLISNAEWGGVRLADVLKEEVEKKWKGREDNLHVEFTGLDGFTKSIPLKHVMKRSNNVLIVHEMNGEPLPRDHGSPFRLIAPGLVGAYQIKWLQSVEIIEKQSDSPWQTKFYTFHDGTPIKKWPHTSFITSHENHGLLSQGQEIFGLAYAGGGKVVAGVQVSADGGDTWHDASWLPDEKATRWTWRRWKIDSEKILGQPPPDGEVSVMVRVVDETKAGIQPEKPKDAVKETGGYLFNAIHEVTLNVG
jgi:sulfite oxidase